MTSPFLSRYRRVLVLGAATVALHYLTIDWLAARIGLRAEAPQAPATVSAQLRLALPEPIEVPAPAPEAVPEPKPAADPAPPRRRKTAPEPAPASSDQAATPAESGGTMAPADGDAAEQGGAAETPPALQSPEPAPAVPPVPAAAEPAPPAATPPVSAGRRFRVNLPPPAAFELEVRRKDADGRNWSGVADMHWQTDGSSYQVNLNVGISLLVARVDLLSLTSEGSIDDAGIAPLKMTEKRRSRSMTATHFHHDERRISFSASAASVPLLAGAQDKATVPFQLAAIGRGDVNQFAGDIDIQVGEDKGATMYRFVLVGEEELETKMGRLVTWRLARPPRPGSYNARLDIWLAPSLGWYPVQIRNTEGNGAVTTQTVTKILQPPVH